MCIKRSPITYTIQETGQIKINSTGRAAEEGEQATTDPRIPWRLLDTHGQVWVCLFWGHCSFLLGPGAHKVLFVPSKSLFPQFCVSSGSSRVGLIVTSSKRTYAIPRSAAPRAPRRRPLLTRTSAVDTQSQFWLSLCGVSWCSQGFV